MPAGCNKTGPGQRKNRADLWAAERLNFQDFEDNFKLASAATSSKIGVVARPSSPDLVTLLDPERIKKISICSRKLGMAGEAIVKAVDSLDVKSLSQERVEILLGLIPNEQEIKMLLGYSDDPDQLRPEDRWLMPFCRIERYEAKLKVMAFMLDFDRQVETLRPQVDVIRKASDKMVSCEPLEALLDVSLALVNYSNSGKRPPAVSINSDGLNQLADVRASSGGNSENLLAYAIQQLDAAGQSKFYQGLQSDVEQAAKVSVDNIKTAVKELQTGMRLVQQETKTRRERQEVLADLEGFQQKAEARLSELTGEAEGAGKSYADCLTYFAEPVKDSNVYFGAVAKFIRTYQAVEARLESRRKLQESKK